MLFVYIGVYIIFCAMIWGFFFVMRVDAMKYVNFSHHLKNVMDFLFLLLLLCTIAGFILLFFMPINVSNFFDIGEIKTHNSPVKSATHPVVDTDENNVTYY